MIDQSIEQLNKKFIASGQRKDEFLTKIVKFKFKNFFYLKKMKNGIQNEINNQIKNFDSIYNNLVSKHSSNLDKMCVEFKQNTIKLKLELIKRLEDGI